jgi:hypothetical protein
MSYRGVRNWPPKWRITRSDHKPLSGEVGTLEQVDDRCNTLNAVIITMILDDVRYMADLRFDDFPFCKQIYELLQQNIGRSIEEIGDLDMSYTL